jgi:hypothetical protein
MNRPFPTRIGSLAIVVGLTGVAWPAAAQPAPTLRIILQVHDHANVPLHLVARSKPEVTRIYRSAGIDVMWSDGASRAGGPDSRRSPRVSGRGFALVVVPREITDRLAVATNALGGAAGTPEERGRMAYVFYNRVERVARTSLNTSIGRENYDIDTVIVLAHAMAHEVGHLLLPYGHSATGLMRANWDGQDLRRAVRGQLNFTTDEAAKIRANLSTRPVRPFVQLPRRSPSIVTESDCCTGRPTLRASRTDDARVG